MIWRFGRMPELVLSKVVGGVFIMGQREYTVQYHDCGNQGTVKLYFNHTTPSTCHSFNFIPGTTRN
jgi:hypothetical protein